MTDRLIRAITADGMVKATAVTTRELTERARQIHKTLPVVTAALGRTLAAASMMGNALKEDGASVTLQIKGGGPLGTLLAVLVAVAVYGVLLIKLHCIEEDEMYSMPMGRKLTRICRKLHLM